MIEQLEGRIVLAAGTDILTFHGDTASTGVNATETVLTPATVTVNSFGKLYTTTVDGQVYAEPLIKTGVTITAGVNTQTGATGVHDVAIVATQHDSLYAIDSSSTGGKNLWQRSFLDTTVTANNNFGATSITSVPSNDTGSSDISPEVGITGTPVIDASTGTIYVVVKTKETISGADYYVQRIHAVNISDGTDRVSPYVIGRTAASDGTNTTSIYVYGSGDGSITDPYNGTGNPVVQFSALREAQRGALSLVNNSLYVEWASHGDNGPYHGLVAKWDVSNLSTAGFVLTGVLNTSPNDGLSGIWQGGGRLVFEPDASAFYFVTGNGSGGAPTLDSNGFPVNGNYNEAVVKVVADATTGPTHQNINGWGFKVSDYFTPYNVEALDNADSDFGSGAPILLPDSAGIPGHPHLMIAGGKEGKLYLIDRDNMGHFDVTNDHVLNSVPDGSGHNTPPSAVSGLLSTADYFNGKLYVVSGYSGKAYTFTINSDGSLTDTSETAVGSFGYLPGSPTISANGTSTGVVWIPDRNANVLHAYDAATLSTELWNSNQKVGGGDSVGAINKFAVPTVANGEVYVGTTNALVVYGILVPPTHASQPPVLSATTLSGSAINLTWTDSSVAPNTADSYSIEISTDNVNFSVKTTAPTGTRSIAIGGLQPLTHYYIRIIGHNSKGNSAPSNVAQATTTSQVALLDFSGGFAPSSQLTINGSTAFNGTRLELTDLNTGEAGSAFSTDPVDVTGFSSQFVFQVAAGSDIADGFTFTIQGNSATTVGASGGDLGFGGMNQSVAIKFDLYDNAGEGTSSTGLFLNGVDPFNTGSIDLLPSSIDLHSGDQFRVNLDYNGTTLNVTILDTQTSHQATQAYTVDIPSIVGNHTAYVGFTGGTGGLGAVQDILNWTYSPNAAASPAAPSGLGATAASATSVALSWTRNATNQTGYHLDRATDANFTQNLVTQTLPALATAFTDSATGLAPAGTFYYRLRAFNSVGDSDSSNTAQVTIPVAPPKPTLQQLGVVTANSISLSWQDNAGHQADGYRILRATNHGSFSVVARLPPTSRTAPSQYGYTDSGLTPNTFYEYHIVAYNVSGNNDFAGLNATTLVDHSPVLTGYSGTQTYVKGTAAVLVARFVVVTDSDSPKLASAVVQFTSWQPEDRLAFSNSYALQHTFVVDAAHKTATLTLAGPATPAQYQTTLRSIVYSDVAGNPIKTGRGVSIIVNDGSTNSNAATGTILVSKLDHAPSGTSATLTALENVGYVLKLADFGFTDPNDSPSNSFLAVKFPLLPTAGTMTDNGVAVAVNRFVSAADISSGKLVFTPNTNLLGGPFFMCKFQVQDDGGSAGGGVSLDPSAKVLDVKIRPLNHAPTGASNTVSTRQNAAYTLKTSDFGFADPNDTPPNNLLAVKISLLPTAGTLFDNGTAVTVNQFVSASDISSGKLTFTPKANLTGGPLFLCRFQVQDNGGTLGGGVDLDPTLRVLDIKILP